jgi:glycosyltransferase involved in cell wall biosynthesis
MHSTTPLISAVVPAFNAERTIATTIRSVLSQTFDNFEVVICDDASTDHTSEVVRSFSDSRIRLISNPHNMGEGMARDHAIEASNGSWIALLDADDAWTPNRLEVLVGEATSRPGAIVFDEMMECHDTPQGLKQWRPIRGRHVFPGDPDAPRTVDFSDWITRPRTIMQPLLPARLIREYDVRHTTKRYSADLEFMLKLIGCSHARLWYVPQAMYLYRVTAGSMSTIPNRYSLLAHTLEEALDLFAWNPPAQSAIRRKAEDVQKAEKYHIFFSQLMSGHMVKAGKIAVREPWTIFEFVRRSMTSVPYHLSRWLHGGARRRTV